MTEKGRLLSLFALEAGPFRCQFRICTLAHVDLHALARRLQHGLDASQAAVLRDLTALRVAHHGLADSKRDAHFTVPLDHDGAWLGNVQLVHGPALASTWRW